jgi:hypothetical protein
VKMIHPQVCKDGSNTFCPQFYIATNTHQPHSCRCEYDTPENRKKEGYHPQDKDVFFQTQQFTRNFNIPKWF